MLIYMSQSLLRKLYMTSKTSLKEKGKADYNRLPFHLPLLGLLALEPPADLEGWCLVRPLLPGRSDEKKARTPQLGVETEVRAAAGLLLSVHW